ncbi:MAG: di-trans,poly-cis-decaprenylcistransferase [Candidatus Sungbacteria bacterium RIFCSPLOWO2_01_FULL_60_25]|uniref:Isoprenyl transferase n=1 Tax=Candidatus Sungbacteria bacterium RIFCSPLOWO2_01_FULL_60_25 TaxID=1802281 RepID=A0A1G2LG56_9BACT|nr:MAG: di-trans,poly-cis-decaprenylcistransferase [Candidatus Sungbacteria bacterium RIFCSPLOWO2_01_FULL_60_25]
MTTPNHVAIIMDGNRRWAVRRGLSRIEGHRHGLEALRKIVPAFIERKISVVSLFAFSTENWRRTQEEVSVLMGLIKRAFEEHFQWLREHDVRVRIAGRWSDFSEDIQRIFREVTEATAHNTGLTANFCLSYGGREELAQAARRIAEEAGGNPAALAAIDEDVVGCHLYTAGLPDVDLLIRTSGEHRISNFLLWQSAYAELYFTEAHWPDFTPAELDKALAEFSTRKRNFGT